MSGTDRNGQHPDRLTTDRTEPGDETYQQVFARLADTHRGRPAHEILPLLRRAADRALLEFTEADLREQAQAISTGRHYTLRVTVI